MSAIDKTMARVRWALVIAACATAVYSVVTYGGLLDHEHEHATGEDRYYCPMHPEVRSPEPGTCPICSMRLVPIPTSRAPAAAEMLPDDAGVPAIPPPDGLVPVEVTIARQQQFGIESVVVSESTLEGERRLPAVVEARQGSSVEVRLRVPAFVERVAVDRTGVYVRRGALLATVFSPEIARLGDELALANGIEGAGDLAAATRTGLRRAGVDPASVEAQPGATTGSSAASGTERGRVAIHAPRAGVVTRFEARQGSYATPEVLLYELTDLDRVAVVASVPLDLLAALGTPEVTSLASRARRATRRGGSDAGAEAGSATRPGVQFQADDGSLHDATFDTTEPSIDAATRTARVRFLVDNADHALLPGAVGTLLVRGAATAGITVPRDAVVDTGNARYVFVDRGLGFFEPRSVTTGGSDATSTSILRGLASGERVVVRGGFLLDSESRIAGAVRTSTPGTPP